MRAETIRLIGFARLADRRGVPPEPAPSPAVHGNSVRSGRGHPRAAAHEPVRRSRPLHSGVRPRGRTHAVRPVPRLHRGCAHAVRGEQPAAPGDAEVQPRIPDVEPDHAVPAAPGARLSRRAVSRHRERPRRGSLRARRGRCRGVLPRAGARPLRGPPGRVAGAQSFDPVDHFAEEGHQRPGHHSRFRAPRGRSSASRLSVRAHRRGRARHQPEALERLEGAAVRGILRAHQARVAPRPRDAGRSGRTDPRDAGERARENSGARARANRAGLVAVDRGVFPALHARGDRLADRPARRPASRRQLAAGRGPAARGARRHRRAHLHPAARAQLRAHHRGPRPDGPQRRRCAPHHQRQRLHLGNLRGSRGQRRGDRRLRPHPRDRARTWRAPCSRRRTRRSP